MKVWSGIIYAWDPDTKEWYQIREKTEEQLLKLGYVPFFDSGNKIVEVWPKSYGFYYGDSRMEWFDKVINEIENNLKAPETLELCEKDCKIMEERIVKVYAKIKKIKRGLQNGSENNEGCQTQSN